MFAWQLTVVNEETVPVTFDATLQWLDRQGFVVGTAYEFNLRLVGGDQQTFRGERLISAPASSQVESIRADLRPD